MEKRWICLGGAWACDERTFLKRASKVRDDVQSFLAAKGLTEQYNDLAVCTGANERYVRIACSDEVATEIADSGIQRVLLVKPAVHYDPDRNRPAPVL